MQVKPKITFVCSGNTCRSPMAAEMFKKRHPDYEIDSAGLFTEGGESANEKAIEVAKKYDIDLSHHVSRELVKEDMLDKDLFVFFDINHLRVVAAVAGLGRCCLLLNGICDPYGGPVEFYESCAREIEKGLDELDEKLKKKAIVRPMTKEDVPAVAEIEEECFSRPWSQNALLEELHNEDQARFFVAEIDHKVVGYIGTISVALECSITNIAVTEKSRHMGIGTKLMERAVFTSRFLGDEFITLEVRVSNTTAIELYKSFRFEIEGTRKNFYRDPQEDAYILTRNFEKETFGGKKFIRYRYSDVILDRDKYTDFSEEEWLPRMFIGSGEPGGNKIYDL